MSRNILESSLHNAGYNIIFQIVCRIVTFGINAFIVRKVDREVLGIMNIRLLLLESTILFLSREGINRAALSAISQKREKCSWAQLINQQWLTVIVCILVCVPCLYVWLYCLSLVDSIYLEQYQFGCYAVAMSCVIEVCAESPVFVSQVFCFVKLRIFINTFYIFVRSVIFLWIFLHDHTEAINGFAFAQLLSSIVTIITYYAFFAYYIPSINNIRNLHNSNVDTVENKQPAWKKQLFTNMDDFPFKTFGELFPGVMHNEGRIFNSRLQILTLSFLKQGVMKQILTEGEKYIMSISPVLTFKEQATYDVVNNFGSLAARFIFRPIEDSSYFYFTQTISRDLPLKEQDKDKVQQASQVLKYVSAVVVSVSLLALVFGQYYSHTILYLYAGSDFVSDELPQSLLKWHCLAICFLAVNGITECYMFAANTSSDIDVYNYLMAIFSICFLGLSYILTSLCGPIGFIFANCLIMFCRICYSIRFIYMQFKPLNTNPLFGFLPGKMFMLSLVISGFICRHSMVNDFPIILHLSIGILCAFLVILIWIAENKDIVQLGWTYRRKLKIS